MATYLLNILPSTSIKNKTPHFRLFQTRPTYAHLCIFECLCFPQLTTSNKLEPRLSLCVFWVPEPSSRLAMSWSLNPQDHIFSSCYFSWRHISLPSCHPKWCSTIWYCRWHTRYTFTISILYFLTSYSSFTWPNPYSYGFICTKSILISLPHYFYAFKSILYGTPSSSSSLTSTNPLHHPSLWLQEHSSKKWVSQTYSLTQSSCLHLFLYPMVIPTGYWGPD